ncbi:hypothetical protein OIV83_002753 [Microbotryomycetes sp. JL201]|nr:hypothetical protein OIV83_002753 [Microbotryomycetes sp. JL201]
MSRHRSGNDDSRISADTEQRIKDACKALDRVVDVLRLLEKDIDQLAKTAELIRPRGASKLIQSHVVSRRRQDRRGEPASEERSTGTVKESGGEGLTMRNDFRQRTATDRPDNPNQPTSEDESRPPYSFPPKGEATPTVGSRQDSSGRHMSHARRDAHQNNVQEVSKARLNGTRMDSASTLRSVSRTPPKRKVVLEGEKVFASISQALLDADFEGRQTLLNLALVHKAGRDVCIDALWRTLTVSSPDKVAETEYHLAQSPQCAARVKEIEIRPLDASSNSPIVDLSEVVANIRRLVSLCPALVVVREDFSGFDWDVSDLRTDWILPLPSPQPLVALTSTKCWWELRALVDLLKHVGGTLKAVRLLGAVMDRDWSGPSLLKRSTTDNLTAITRLEIGQVMHTDTLAVILRLCPHLRILKLSFQVIGTTDNDTPLDSILDALSQVSSSLAHLSVSAPMRQGDQTTRNLLESVVQLLPALEVLEFEEDRKAGDDHEAGATAKEVVEIASPDLLINLPINLRRFKAVGVCSFSTTEVVEFVKAANELAPTLRTLHVGWSAKENGKNFADKDVRLLESMCRQVGIDGRFWCGVQRP